jgi:polyhydroxyalkanoate synthesis repressor PhaR
MTVIPKMVLIKKYENRRLYDTTNSRYVNLVDIAQMVKQGQEIQVLDAATGEDLTRVVLTQIIAENAKAPDSTFPIDVLRQMVIATGKATQESTLKYMQAVLDMYQNAFRAMSPAVSPFEFMRTATAPRPSEPVQSPPAARRRHSPDKANNKSEVDDLKQRLRELETLVSNLPGRKKKARKKVASRRTP